MRMRTEGLLIAPKCCRPIAEYHFYRTKQVPCLTFKARRVYTAQNYMFTGFYTCCLR